jgi:hypothetical protein
LGIVDLDHRYGADQGGQQPGRRIEQTPAELVDERNLQHVEQDRQETQGKLGMTGQRLPEV